MKKALIVLVVLLAALLVNTQTHTFPALDTNNNFTGTNNFLGSVGIGNGTTGFGIGCADMALSNGFDSCLGVAAGGSTANTNSQSIAWRSRDSGNGVLTGTLIQDSTGALVFLPSASATHGWFQAQAFVMNGDVGGGYSCGDGAIPLFGDPDPDCFILGAVGASPNKASQRVEMHAYTAGGVTVHTDLFEDALGNLNITADQGGVSLPRVAFASLPATPPLGTIIDCTNCVSTTAASCSTNTPASCVCKSGTGNAIAKYINFENNGANWYCQ